jgi:hypothetical protein
MLRTTKLALALITIGISTGFILAATLNGGF